MVLTRERTAWPIVRAAAALTVACAAGCGVVHPSTGESGMEKQITMGERVSAATRLHAFQPPAGPAAARAQGPVRGRQVTAIGDSVMAAGAMTLDSVLPGIYIDAEPSRQMPAGIAVVRGLARAGRLRPVVVVGLGTNYIVTTSELKQLMRVIGPHRKLVLINTYEPDQWSKDVNATMAAFVHQHPTVVLADWFDTIRHRTYLLWPDETHPQLAGTRVYAHMVYRAVQATREIPGLRPPLATQSHTWGLASFS
jgi:hypothetical protein